MSRNDVLVPTEGAWRELRRAYHQQRRQLSNLTKRMTEYGKRRSQGPKIPPPRIRFKNTSSETAPAWGVMQITTGGTDDYVAITKQTSSFAGLHLVNGNKDVAADSYGWGHLLTAEAYVIKRQYALYNTAATPAVGESWGPVSGSWLLHQHGPGFYILGGTKGEGETARVHVMQYDTTSILGKTDASVTGSGTVTVSVWGGTSGSEADSGLEIASCRLRNGYVPSACFVTVEFINGQPYIAGDHRTVRGKADSTITDGSTGTFSIWNGAGDTGDNITVTAEGHDLESGLWATAWNEEKSGTWYASLRECP
jgi:hypothetical protein